MKYSASVLLAASVAVTAHYTFPIVDNSAAWEHVRKTTNYQNNGPVQDVTSPQMTCYQLAPGSEDATTYAVKAGQTIQINSSSTISHPGPVSAWLAQVPAGHTAATFDGSGPVWTKIYQEMPKVDASGLVWHSQGTPSVSVTLPACLANNDYLLRIEHIALHSASAVGGAQFYLACAQLTVTGGSGTWSPRNPVSMPGAYKATDPGILVNLYYPVPTNYTPAGPAVEMCP